MTQQSRETLEITVNGETRSVPTGSTLLALLEVMEIASGKVAVERNRSIVPRSTYGDVALQDGDALEIVRFVGGG